MDHGLGIETRIREDLLRLGSELDLPLLATNDLHYTYDADAEAHEVLLCVQTGTTMADPKRFKFDARDFYLKSPAEMRTLWDSELPEACDNTLEIAEQIGDYSAMFAARNLMPQFPVPAGETEECWLRKEVERGLARRFPNGVPEDRRKQAEYELGVILQMGFPGYFLVIADLVAYAKQKGIRVGPGRGSAAGALIAYALGITELDPIQHGLLFERFLNPDRVSMPDIDMDFDERRRGDMIRYATEKYGEERVAQIITYGTIKAKAAIKDAARVLGYPFAVGDRITKAMPPAVMGKDIPLAGIFDPSHPRYPEAAEFRAALRVRRPTSARWSTRPRDWRGSSASGACTRPASSCPGTRCSTSSRSSSASRTARSSPSSTWVPARPSACSRWTSWGCATSPSSTTAWSPSGTTAASTWSWRTCRWTTRPTYELLARGDTLGVFQLDGGPMRALLRSMPPDNFEDISAVARSTGPVRWAPTRTTSTPTARTAASRWCRSTPSWPSRWPRSWATPTG